MIGNFLAESNHADFSEYIDLVSTGRIYERIIDVAKESIDAIITRDEAKTLMFYMLFSSNRGQHEDPMIKQMKKIFSHELFPQVANFFKLLKTNFKEVE